MTEKTIDEEAEAKAKSEAETAELHALYAAEKAEAERAALEAEAKLKAEDEAAAKELPAPSTEGLIRMTKDGQVIHAHPSTVAHHTGNGWKLV